MKSVERTTSACRLVLKKSVYRTEILKRDAGKTIELFWYAQEKMSLDG